MTTNNINNNLNLYIPRISASTTEHTIMSLFVQLNIGYVEYADIVATKNPETKEVQYYSAFIKLQAWGPSRNPADTFQQTKSFKMNLNGYGSNPEERFWWLLPNNNPLPRTKVNVHQLAASTEKLFEQHDAMETEIKELKEQISTQNEIFENLKFKLLMENESLHTKLEEMMYLIRELQVQTKNTNNILPGPPQLIRSSATSNVNLELISDGNWDLPAVPPMLKRSKSIDEHEELIILDDDDCLFSRPVRRETMYLPSKINQEELKTKSSSGFKTPNVSPVSFENSKRAEISREFCGNH